MGARRKFLNPFEELGLTPAIVKAAGEDRALKLANDAYKLVSFIRHPDMGGKEEDFAALEEAIRILRDDPVARKEFFEDYAGITKTDRIASQRAQINDLTLEVRSLQGRLGQVLEAPFVPGSLTRLVPGTKLVVSAVNRGDYLLLTVSPQGRLMKQFVRELEGEHRDIIAPAGAGRSFCQTESGWAYVWDRRWSTTAEDGMWLLGPADADTATQVVYPLEAYGREAQADFELVLALDWGNEVARAHAASNAVISSLNTGIRKSKSEHHVQAVSLGAASEAMIFEPKIGAELIVGNSGNVTSPLSRLGTIQGGLLPKIKGN